MPTFRENIKLGTKVPLMKTEDINDQAITKDKIRDGNVTTEKLADGVVKTNKVSDASITTPKIADGNITTEKLKDSSVTTQKIANGNVTEEKIANQSVTNDKLAPSSVTHDKIKSSSVITEKINDRAVTTEKIDDKAITNQKLDDKSVDARTILEANVQTRHLADEAVTTDKINDGAVTNDKIADGTMKINKLDPELRATLNAATGLPDNLTQVIQDVDETIKELHEKDTDLQSQIDDNLSQITDNDKDISVLQERSTQMENSIKDISATGGASTANAVSFDNTSSGITSVNVQGAIDELQTNKIDKSSIAQELGDSQDKVVSQEFISDALQKKMNLIDFATNTGFLDTAGKVHSEDTNWLYSDFIPFGYKKNIPCKLYLNSGSATIIFYDINKAIIGYITTPSDAVNNSVNDLSIDTVINTAYIRISVISYAFRSTLAAPTLYFGDASLLNFVLECSYKQNITIPTKTVRLLNQVDRICLYGDSISSSDYTWYKDAISKYTGVEKVYSSGFSGYTTSQLAKDAQLKRIFDLLPDLVIIEVGGNDVGDTVGTFGMINSQPTVTETDISKDYDGTYFIQAVDHIIRKVQNNYNYPPYIAVLTPTPQKRSGGDNSWNLHRNWLNKRNAVAEACIKNNVHCIDMFNLWGVDMSKEPSWSSPTDKMNSKGIYTMDGLHPNRIGFEKFAQVITAQIYVHNMSSKNFSNTLFTSTISADGTVNDVSHRCCYMRSRPSYLVGIKFRILTYNVNNCFCAFDKDKNIISKYTTQGNTNIGNCRSVVFGDDVAYYSVLTLNIKDFDKSELIEYYDADLKSATDKSKGILWLGTSIPEGKVDGKSYPQVVGEKLGVYVNNKSLGSSFISTGCYNFNNPMGNLSHSDLSVGKCLTETIDEKEERFRDKVTDGTITEGDLTQIKSYSFENLVLPYIDSVDTIVIDHGYNDRYVIQNQLQEEGFDEIDWQSRDRDTFVGAMNYLIDRIHEKNPRIRIIFSGHYQNVDEICRYVCMMQKALAEHFGYTILELWDFASISPKSYVYGTRNYFTEYNEKYGTNYSPTQKDNNGNYSELVINCPDTVHPHSDVSGETINKIGVILSKLIGG